MIFVDTSFWAALRNRRDDRHARAARLFGSVGARALATTNLVRGETWTLLRSRAGHAAAVVFLDRLHASPRIRLIRVDEDAESEALAWLRRHDERAYSFTDATSFAIMRAHGIQAALTFDDDFVAAGFTLFAA